MTSGGSDLGWYVYTAGVEEDAGNENTRMGREKKMSTGLTGGHVAELHVLSIRIHRGVISVTFVSFLSAPYWLTPLRCWLTLPMPHPPCLRVMFVRCLFRVFCVADEATEDRDGLDLPLAAVAEISLQVPNGRTATPFPLPLWMKRVSFESLLTANLPG